ncbi:MAG: hypothetical protein PHU85_16595 [Phycisphaerae bacterium]|nr:hypothetical protein [Phycisphaerae bacterium]
MNNTSKLFAIAVLAITAVLLLCTLVIMDRMPANAALGVGTSEHQGDYILAVGATQQGDDCVYVIDTATQKMGVYWANTNQSRLDVKAQLDLGNMGAPVGKVRP